MCSWVSCYRHNSMAWHEEFSLEVPGICYLTLTANPSTVFSQLLSFLTTIQYMANLSTPTMTRKEHVRFLTDDKWHKKVEMRSSETLYSHYIYSLVIYLKIKYLFIIAWMFKYYYFSMYHAFFPTVHIPPFL